MHKLVVSRWYIVNSSWVKNVNKLRKIDGISGVNISTKQHTLVYLKNTMRVQTSFLKYCFLYYPTTLYTHLTNKITLLNKSFTYYPQSLLMRLLKEI